MKELTVSDFDIVFLLIFCVRVKCTHWLIQHTAEFNEFLNCLNVKTVPTDMSFGVSADGGTLEWGSTSLWSFIGSLKNLLSLWWWRLVFDIIRFNFCATELLSELSDATRRLSSTPLYCNNEKDFEFDITPSIDKLESIGEYLNRKNYSEQFKKYYIIPMVAAPWCIDPNEFSQNFPAVFLIRFMYVSNCPLLHGMSNELS